MTRIFEWQESLAIVLDLNLNDANNASKTLVLGTFSAKVFTGTFLGVKKLIES